MTLTAIHPWWRGGDRKVHRPARDADTPLIALPAGLADPNRGAPTFAAELSRMWPGALPRANYIRCNDRPNLFIEATFPDK
jgi:hypothetical protein